MKREMFYNADATIFQKAKELRNQPTDAERILWMYLRTRPGGFKFRRQHPAGNYILDFYCYQLNLAIEVDGPIHDKEENKIADTERQNYIESLGITIMRFTNNEIQRHMESVIEKINLIVNECQKRK